MKMIVHRIVVICSKAFPFLRSLKIQKKKIVQTDLLLITNEDYLDIF